jgi:hypothetical protein
MADANSPSKWRGPLSIARSWTTMAFTSVGELRAVVVRPSPRSGMGLRRAKSSYDRMVAPGVVVMASSTR